MKTSGEKIQRGFKLIDAEDNDNNLEDEESFLVLEACHEYPEHRDNDLGEWHENPWGVFREVRVSIDWC